VILRQAGTAPLLVTLALALAACGGGGEAKRSVSGLERAVDQVPVAPAPANVIADDDYFLPKALKVRGGSEVTFSNDGRRLHNVIPLDGGTFRIDTDELRPGASTTVRLDRPGTYRYFCSIHGTATRGMRGIIKVVR
jgi:plastocyanin